MKKLLLFLLFTVSTFGQVGINTANPQAVLDIQSTTSGILIPRLTTEEKNNIENPAISMLVFDTELNAFSYFNGNFWNSLEICVNYSLDEIKTNDTWIDGKPIYRKVINAVTSSNNSDTTIDLSELNISECIKMDGYFVYGTQRTRINTIDDNGINASRRVYFAEFNTEDGGVIYFSLKEIMTNTSLVNYLQNMNLTVILEYTKTTD
jgi:hypothetical protein